LEKRQLQDKMAVLQRNEHLGAEQVMKLHKMMDKMKEQLSGKKVDASKEALIKVNQDLKTQLSQKETELKVMSTP
jgi:hypothetical protein